METLLQMILPSALLPALLSIVVWWANKQKPITIWALPLIWLPSYVWLIGWPSLIPAEANHWLYMVAIISVLIVLFFKSLKTVMPVMQTVLLGLALFAIAWPVLHYNFSWLLLLEMLAVTIVAYLFFNFSNKSEATSPALTMATSGGGMGLVVALGGSLLIGQLAGALASVLMAFVIVELGSKCQKPAFDLLTIVPLIQLYFLILVIARIFAELPLAPSILLLLAPLVGLIPGKRFASAFSISFVIAALAWLLLTADSSGYH